MRGRLDHLLRKQVMDEKVQVDSLHFFVG